MGATTIRREAPESPVECAEVLSSASAASEAIGVTGGGSKASWGGQASPVTELSTVRLDRVVEHNVGDLTAVLEAGLPLAVAQASFAEAGQMLALDPPGERATVGGVIATADSGPLRSRYGAARDLVVGMTAALPDGTLAKSGGKVIKNVAGYDLPKLFAGSFGSLGVIVQVSVRLHPLPPATATVIGEAGDPAALAAGAAALSHSPFEHQALDVRWAAGRGAILARFGGVEPRAQAGAAERLLAGHGLETDIVEDDDAAWEAQRSSQRSATGTVVRVSGLQSGLATVLRTAERLGAHVVGRAGLGLSWLRVEDRATEELVAAVKDVREALSPSPCPVLDAPPQVRAQIDPWGPVDPGALELMRRVKRRFDPGSICNPGVYVGGI